MNRSTSYLATASAIRSAPSTWTSSREKFLVHWLVHLAKAGVLSSRGVLLLRGVVPPDQVVDNIRMPNARFNRLGIVEVVFLNAFLAWCPVELRARRPYDKCNSAQITSDLEMALGHLLPVGNDDLASLPCCSISL